MKKLHVWKVEDKIYIYFGHDSQDVSLQLMYDGKLHKMELGEADMLGEISMNDEDYEKIMAEFNSLGECDWCGDMTTQLRDPHLFDFAPGKRMCKNCWNHDRGVYLGSYGDDIGPFDEHDDSKQCGVCKKFVEGKMLLVLDSGETECEDCAQAMSDLAP